MTLPRGHTTTVVQSTTYYVHDGVYYERTYSGAEVAYVAISTPVGVTVTTLPVGYTTTVVGVTTYYVHQNVYYVPSGSTYVVVIKP